MQYLLVQMVLVTAGNYTGENVGGWVYELPQTGGNEQRTFYKMVNMHGRFHSDSL